MSIDMYSSRQSDLNRVKTSIAFGTWKLAREDACQAVQSAISVGYRHVDTAAAYANESEIGAGIASSEIPRDAVLVSGKLWNAKRSYATAIKACKKSLRNMGLTYFDQYLVHWPATPKLYENWREINNEAWRALETLYDEGLVRRIGVCNFKTAHLAELLSSAHIRPMVNQIELHPGYPQPETCAFCKQNDIALEAWSPLGNGQLLSNSLICTISDKYSVSPAQVCLRWCQMKGAKPITKSLSVTHMQESLTSAAVPLSEDDCFVLSSMETCAFSGMDPDEITDFG